MNDLYFMGLFKKNYDKRENNIEIINIVLL